MRTLKYLESNTYSEPSQRFEMEYFAKIVKSYNHFSKVLYLRSLTGLWMHPSLNQYSLTFRETLCIFRTLFFCRKLRHSGIFTSDSDIFSHIVIYLKSCETLAYSESCHVQNAGIFKTQDILCQGIFWHIQDAVWRSYI